MAIEMFSSLPKGFNVEFIDNYIRKHYPNKNHPSMSDQGAT
jgi:hypothetical protein